jgi:hypothetical protein
LSYDLPIFILRCLTICLAILHFVLSYLLQQYFTRSFYMASYSIVVLLDIILTNLAYFNHKYSSWNMYSLRDY